jgi:hypothetical protein
VAFGDEWMNTSVNPPTLYVATSVSPSVTWSPLRAGGTLSGDGSQLTNLNASQLNSGTVPGPAFPANISFSNLTTGNTSTNYLQLTPSTCGVLSPSGSSTFCMNSSSNTVQLSTNGGSYSPLGSGGGGSSSSNSLVNQDGTLSLTLTNTASSDPYSFGLATTNGRKATMIGPQGSLWQVLVFGDAGTSADTIFALGASQNSGSSWGRWFAVTQAGQVRVPYLTLDPIPSYSCTSANAGEINYIQGNSSTKDIVQVCAHDNTNTYAWRPIY